MDKPYVAGFMDALKQREITFVTLPKPDLSDFFNRIKPGCLSRTNTLTPEPSIRLPITQAFREAIETNLALSLETSFRPLKDTGGYFQGDDLFACYGIPSKGPQKLRAPYRYWVILQALNGYVFVANTPSGTIEVPLQPGMILALNEDWDWSLKAPLVCRLSVPCIVYSIPVSVEKGKSH